MKTAKEQFMKCSAKSKQWSMQ